MRLLPSVTIRPGRRRPLLLFVAGMVTVTVRTVRTTTAATGSGGMPIARILTVRMTRARTTMTMVGR